METVESALPEDKIPSKSARQGSFRTDSEGDVKVPSVMENITRPIEASIRAHKAAIIKHLKGKTEENVFKTVPAKKANLETVKPFRLNINAITDMKAQDTVTN